MTLFLNGAAGNIHFENPTGGPHRTKEEGGEILADDVGRILESIEFKRQVKLGSHARTIRLPFRQPTDDEWIGKVKGAQRFIDPMIYEREMPRVRERIRRQGAQPAEVQVLTIDNVAFAGIPAECFVEYGLRIKEEAHPAHALVVSCANGMVGYVPTREAFRRGGCETTLCDSGRLAPEAGDLLANCAT
ncbi:MAG: hypothetical protein NTW86_29970 [Candidatus Sumerlaeota bacterium]|nr:hypothetical protein [Candidatus Sumerlaeota bacterium]